MNKEMNIAEIDCAFAASAGGHQCQIVFFQVSVRAERKNLRGVYCPEQVKAYGMAALATNREPRMTDQSG
jgi:hypothetical protein